MGTSPEPPEPAPVRPGRSVFDDGTGAPASPHGFPPAAAWDEDDIAPVEPATGVIEVEWDDWDDEPGPPSRTAWIVAGVLFVAVLVVGGLVVRAVNTDAELAVPSTTTTAPGSPATTAAPATPTVEALAAVVPDALDSCVPPPEQPADGSVRLDCPRDEQPELVSFTLFPDRAARDQAFDDTVATLGLDPGAPGECALGGGAVHDYVGRRGRGRMACRAVDDRVDIAWTDGTDPVLATAGGFGSYATHYRFWAGLVDRRDADFPLPLEQALLDEIPPELQARCRRDLPLNVDAPGIAAVACEPATGAAELVSWVRFANADAMTAWIDLRRAALADSVVDAGPDACTPEGAGPTGQLPLPWLGVGAYQRDGTTGRILCFVNTSDQNVLFWTRAGVNVGSIAVSDATVPGSMPELLRWWQDGGHRP